MDIRKQLLKDAELAIEKVVSNPSKDISLEDSIEDLDTLSEHIRICKDALQEDIWRRDET